MADPKQQHQKPEGPSFLSRGWMFWVLILLMVVLFYNLSADSFTEAKKIDLGAFINDIQRGNVEQIAIKPNYWEAQLREPGPGEQWPHGAKVKLTRYEMPYSPDSIEGGRIMAAIDNYNLSTAVVEGTTKPVTLINDTASGKLWTLVVSLLPWFVILGVLYFFFFRHMRGAGGQSILAFGKSRARLMMKEHTKVTFDDVAGVDEAKEEVREIVEFLKNPAKFKRLGGRLPCGVLLVGQPGTGKTLLAMAIAGEADTPFFTISGSDFVEMFVGVGASRVRDLFQQAKASSPCIIFLDEIDAVGRLRGSGIPGGGHDEREQTLNAILVEMDGFETDDSVIVIAATNRPDVLDPALLRPGRFDRQVVVDLPDINGREAILKVHAKKVKLKSTDDLRAIARSTPMFSGADLENLINEAAILATMRDRESVELTDLEEARDRVIWGREKKSRVIEHDERRMIAFHEAGHAIVSHLHPNAEPLHKVAIIPRGMMLGATISMPRKDSYVFGRKKAMAEIATLMGGRVAEELFLDDIQAGASSDLRRATDMARRMVMLWGMSDELGSVVYRQEDSMYPRDGAHESISASIADKIDIEVRKLIDGAKEKARDILQSNSDAVRAVVEELLKREVLTAAEVDLVIRGEKLPEIALPPVPPIEQKEQVAGKY